jgi:hypothetical protein
VIAGCAGCLTKPDPAGSCPWAVAATPLGPFAGSQHENAPWMSKDHSSLWFTDWTSRHQLLHVDPLDATPTPLPTNFDDLVTNYDDPFLDDNGALWFGHTETPGSVIYEAPKTMSGFAPPMAHVELGVAQALEPSLTQDGLKLYFSDGMHLFQATRGPGDFLFLDVKQLQLAPAGLAQSPSVTADGTELYFKDYRPSPAPAHISHALIQPDGSLVDLGEVGSFQDPAVVYFDPDISSDGKTLVFATPTATGSSMFYVSRDCAR